MYCGEITAAVDRRGAVVDDHLVRLDVDALVERLPQHVERLVRREADVDGETYGAARAAAAPASYSSFPGPYPVFAVTFALGSIALRADTSTV